MTKTLSLFLTDQEEHSLEKLWTLSFVKFHQEVLEKTWETKSDDNNNDDGHANNMPPCGHIKTHVPNTFFS